MADLRRARELAGLTLDQLAVRLGEGPETVSSELTIRDQTGRAAGRR